jgi:MFS family permease
MSELVSSLRSLNAQVWVQATGRLLCQVGFGLIRFYIPILFVNQVGLSATSVGVSLGLSSVSEVVSHLLGGAISDSPRFGRKVSLSLSAILGMAVSLILVISNDIILLTIAGLLLGLSLGFYWTTSSAAVMDATTPEERHKAFALMGVAEYIGVGIGILSGGFLLMFLQQTPQWVFIGCGVIFLAFLVMIQTTMTTTQQPHANPENLTQGIIVALKDKRLLVFVLANAFYAIYVALATSTIPLYFTNFVAGSDNVPGMSVTSTANLFTWCYIGVGAIVQLPIAQLFTSFPRVRVLMVSMLMWAMGFFLLWAAGTFGSGQFFWSMGGLAILAIASVSFKPFAVAIVSDLSPAAWRGAYTAVSSQCWTIGYLVGPIIGGWAMDQPAAIAHLFWLAIAASTLACILILWLFEAMSAATVQQFSETEVASEP